MDAPDPTPGADVSSPEDTRGEGTVGLPDRTAPGGQGSPDTNQSKTEPMPPTPGHADPAGTGPHTEPPGAPDLGSMSAGEANASVARPVGAGLGTSTPTAPAAAGPAPAAGEMHRAPGLMGTPGADESVGTDVEAGAARMAVAGSTTAIPFSGDSQGVPVPHGEAAAGTSEEEPAVQGVRTPDGGGTPG